MFVGRGVPAQPSAKRERHEVRAECHEVCAERRQRGSAGDATQFSEFILMYNTTKQFNNLRGKRDTVILGIESSCDETAAAIVRGGREVLSSVISSQIEIHKRFGGVVPEIASRNHTMSINGVVDEALKTAGMNFSDLDAIAVTYGAGLAGALLVGVSAAKAYSYANNLPLIKVNHIEGHIAANYVQFKDLTPPFTAVVASGGHTSLIDVKDYNVFSLIGGTVDDAIGEAFDKVARLLGLPYPGGPNIDRLSKKGTPNINFFKTQKGVRKDLSLSYSGLKTAVVNYVHNLKQKGEEIPVEDICASFTHNAVDLLCDTAVAAAENLGHDKIVLAGGVASNTYLRESLAEKGGKRGFKVLYPQPVLCTDNAVMIASRAFFSAFEGQNLADLSLNAVSNLRI